MSTETLSHPFDNPQLHVYELETWDEAKCQEFVKHHTGYREPFGGMLAAEGCAYDCWGRTKYYNGGIVVEGEWKQGVVRPMPKIPHSYIWVYKLSWGIYLRPNDKENNKKHEVVKVDQRGRIIS